MTPQPSDSAATPEVICGAVYASCRCASAPHNDTGPHVCECGGSWEHRDGRFIFHAVPGVASMPDNPVVALFAELFGPQS